MKKNMLKIFAGVVLLSGLGISSVYAAAVQAPKSQGQTGGAVQIQGNTDLNTNVDGGVKQAVEGSNNKAITNVGGMQGTVQIQGNTKVNTNVKGGVANAVKGSGNTSEMNIGGVQGK
ncbi:MAG: hypothetical protein HW380_3450 [Magnetococcales bacterium]|nr:hypothetical protein [Magnetococcales bacterium]